jgi:UDP-GlcNAc3NAcA epimerase
MKLLTIIGARPQFVKCAPVSKAIRRQNTAIREILVHTGQHYDYMMSKVFFDELGIPQPDYNLGVGSSTHGHQTAEMIKRIEEILLKERPELVMIYGDTNSTLAGALATSKLNIPLAHIEAGLRSYNKKMPEEINRVVADHVSSLLLCPTETAVANLRREGFTSIANEGRLLDNLGSVYSLTSDTALVVNVGDVMYDAMMMSVDIAEKKANIAPFTSERGITRYCLATVHRAENTDDPVRFAAILKAFIAISAEITVIWPVHPRTRKMLNTHCPTLGRDHRIVVTEPVGYFDMLELERKATAILTDSGGVQKEAYWLKVPCVTLRRETEWVETVQSRCNTIAPAAESDIPSILFNSLRNLGDFDGLAYGDGNASGKIAELIKRYV